MTTARVSRRQFLAAASVGGAAGLGARPARAARQTVSRAPALLGGAPVRTTPFSPWPVWREADEAGVLAALRRGVWSRGPLVTAAERRVAELMGAPRCLATSNGTNAIFTAVRALGIGAGDEVITTPYTFAATIQPILLSNALPIFADIDPVTWQLDPAAIEAKITPRTVAILPVHIVGGICDMDRIMAIARKHNLKVVEDACEAHMGEWQGRKVGTIGDLGCFSFQTGKAITCGEGGAVLGRDDRLMDICYAFHNLGRPYGKHVLRGGFGHPLLATKCRMAEYQAAILLAQIEAVEGQARTRSENAAYLNAKLRQIPGVEPRRDYPGVTRTAFYYLGFRYRAAAFDGLSRDRFVAALEAEGIPTSTGLGVIEGKPVNKEGMLADAFRTAAYQRAYDPARLERYASENECPLSDRLCEETVGFHQRMLLGTRADMDDIVNAVAKVYEHRARLRT